MARLRAEANEVMAHAPPGVRVSLKAIRDAAAQAMNPAAPAIRHAPKAVRGRVAQPIYNRP